MKRTAFGNLSGHDENKGAIHSILSVKRSMMSALNRGRCDYAVSLFGFIQDRLGRLEGHTLHGVYKGMIAAGGDPEWAQLATDREGLERAVVEKACKRTYTLHEGK